MNENLYLTILQTQKIQYVEYDSEFNLKQYSPGLSSFFSPDRVLETGAYITDTFIELLGYESYLTEIRDGKAQPLYLDWINQSPLSISDPVADNKQLVEYFNLQVYPFHSGLLVILRDITRESRIEQAVFNRQNELDLLSRKLIDDLKQANKELNHAYQTTLEGWSKTLEMRDVETKGHSVRVVELTRRLAMKMGIEPDDIAFYCYGALLHDIGKVGIPDYILLKPGPLNEEEWTIMKQHPLFAKELLANIKYLSKATCIPIYHHEMWNGKGYPYGLIGKEIPLPARVFSVVDVYDALSSSRPYRPAWMQEDVLSYIANQSGINFDPDVVECFLALFR